MSIVAAFLAVPLAATFSSASIWGNHKRSSEKAVNLTLTKETQIANGPQLSPGTYHVIVPENEQTPEVVFYRDGKEVARAKANLVNDTKKNTETEVYSTTQGNSQVINEIRPAGWNGRLVFGGSTGSNAPGE